MPEMFDPLYTTLRTRSWQPDALGYDITTDVTTIGSCSVREKVSSNSPRENGVLQYRQNPAYLLKGKIIRGRALIAYANEPLNRYQSVEVVGPLSLARPQLSDNDTELRAAAWGKVYNKVTELRANVALMLAERRESMEVVIDTMARIAKFYKAIKNRDLRHAAALAGLKLSRRRSRRGNANASSKELSNLYLQFTLGLMPTAMDVYNLVAGTLRPLEWNISESMSKNDEQQVMMTGDKGDWNCTVGIRQRCSVHIRATIPDTLAFSANFLDQFGFTNPAALAWELLPLSFVANWFIDMGSFLSQFSAFTGMEITEISETYTAKCAILESSFIGPTPQAGFNDRSATQMLRQGGYFVEKRRVLLQEPPILPPQFGPGISDAMVGKSITLAALVRQFIK